MEQKLYRNLKVSSKIILKARLIPNLKLMLNISLVIKVNLKQALKVKIKINASVIIVFMQINKRYQLFLLLTTIIPTSLGKSHSVHLMKLSMLSLILDHLLHLLIRNFAMMQVAKIMPNIITKNLVRMKLSTVAYQSNSVVEQQRVSWPDRLSL